MPTEVELAWLAGIIDGEGCVYAQRISENALTFRIALQTASLSMNVRVHEILTDACIEHILDTPRYQKLSIRMVYGLRVQKKRAVLQAVNLILPYCVVKQAELLVVKSYLDKSTSSSMYRATEEDMAAYGKLRELKRIA